jgi:hypothetical protein
MINHFICMNILHQTHDQTYLDYPWLKSLKFVKENLSLTMCLFKRTIQAFIHEGELVSLPSEIFHLWPPLKTKLWLWSNYLGAAVTSTWAPLILLVSLMGWISKSMNKLWDLNCVHCNRSDDLAKFDYEWEMKIMFFKHPGYLFFCYIGISIAIWQFFKKQIPNFGDWNPLKNSHFQFYFIFLWKKFDRRKGLGMTHFL